jgi:chromosomal replication initiation ATPase DnaA
MSSESAKSSIDDASIAGGPAPAAPSESALNAEGTALVAPEYERLADLFSRIYSETRSIAVALELLDAERARNVTEAPIDLRLPSRVLAVAASLYYVKPARKLAQPGNHRDISRARWVASWLLRKHGWTTLKIGRFLSVDHSTVIYGLRRIAADPSLRRMAHAAADLLARDSLPGAP